MERKRKLVIFPEKYGFFPYIFLIYLVMPIMGMTAERGLKAVFGYGMLALFLVTYRQLFCLMGEKSYSYWLAIQLGIVFVLGVWYDPNNLFMGFFPA
ncbi:MAG TPA: sensor histidine kinase, partial [Bacillaceae bacterium]